MRKEDIEIAVELARDGVPGRLLRNINWSATRYALSHGAPLAAIKPLLLGSILDWFPSPATLAGDAVGVAGDIVGGVLDKVIPPSPPLPPGSTFKLDLRNCKIVPVGRIPANGWAQLDISNNGDTFPASIFDTSGEVEVITDPPLPSPPGSPAGTNNTISGDNSMVIDGPRMVWVHLKGEENACDVKVSVFPGNAPR